MHRDPALADAITATPAACHAGADAAGQLVEKVMPPDAAPNVALASDSTGATTDALSSPSALRAAGLEAFARGDLGAAQRLLDAAHRLDPFDHEVLGDLAAIALNTGDVARTLRLARRALFLEPMHDPSSVALALATAATGDDTQAIALLRQVTEGARGDALRVRDPHLARWAEVELARLRGEAPLPPIEIVDPRTLSFRHRFDVLAKVLYALARLQRAPAWLEVDATTLYAKHIHVRTGGAEPGDEARKGSLADFARQFDQLIDAMATGGFDPAHPIPVSAEDGLLRNGAHRLAAALAVGCDVATTAQAGPGGRWDYDWFRVHGFSLEERNALLRVWAQIKGELAGVVLLWSPVESAWAELEAKIDRQTPVVTARSLELPRAAFDELVHDVYSFDWGPKTGANIHRKVSLLAAHAPRLRVLFVERPNDQPAELMRQIKTELRDQYRHLSPADHFTTLHVTESVREMQHLLSIFASENNLRWLRRRPALRPEFVAKLDEMVRLVRERGIDPADCCVVGASVLDALGLRAADDVDFTLRSALRFEHFDGGVTHLSPAVDVVSFNYPRTFGALPALPDDRMIDEPSQHFLVRGIRFADPRVVLARKQHQRRDKDLRDVALLGDFFERAGVQA